MGAHHCKDSSDENDSPKPTRPSSHFRDFQVQQTRDIVRHAHSLKIFAIEPAHTEYRSLGTPLLITGRACCTYV
uniref:Uncharacterized protein n=1 Tax=Parascaris equorum TaxID=6256 RepID=A0A914RU91_PAREQ